MASRLPSSPTLARRLRAPPAHTPAAGAPFRPPAARSGSGGPSVRPTVPVTWTSLGLALVLGGGLVAYYQYEKHERQTQAMGKVISYGKPALGGPFSLVTLDGVPVTDASYSDGYMLLYFGFT